MSIKGDIFKAIGDKLMQKLQFPDGSLPNLMWYDKDFGQAKLMQDGIIAMPLPAILFTFRTPNWNSTSSNIQHGESVLRVRVVFENYADSFEGSVNQDKAIQFFEFNEKVHLALQGMQGENFTSLTRNGDDEDDDHNNVVVTDIFYSTIISDESADTNSGTEVENPSISHTQTDITREEVQTDHGWVLPA